MNKSSSQADAAPISLSYEADLCGNIEQALKGLQGYGIMALELIQNADDARARTLSFDATTDALLVTNGASFSSCGLTAKRCPWETAGDPRGEHRPCNFHAIARMGSRSKLHSPENIGRFGIGFVAVYQITDTPIIRSAGTELRLNPRTGEAEQRRLPTKDGTEFELPWASKPSDVRSALNASPTPPDVAVRLVSEVSAILRSSLLFLRHLERVEVRRDGKVQMTVDIERSANGIALTFGPDWKTEQWLVLSREADDIIAERGLLDKYEMLAKLDRSRTVSVAIATDRESIDGCLYAYLPTQHRTGMQLHVNADFFPHASRQEIVLKGEGHERFWNEALIGTAAVIVSEHFDLLRNNLGHSRLWQLGSDALLRRGDGPFAEFWKRFSSAAKGSKSVWTTAKNWHVPAGTYLAPEQMQRGEQEAIASIDLKLLDQSLRPHWTALAAVGVSELRLSSVVSRLEALKGSGITEDNQHVGNLWAAIGRLISLTRGRPGFAGEIKKLKAATFLIDIDRDAVCPDQVWRMPIGVSSAVVRQYLSGCPIVSTEVLADIELASLIDEYALDHFARNLAEAITDARAAEEIIETAPDGVSGLYKLMMSFRADLTTTKASEILAQTPFLRTPLGFVSPARGRLPGGFEDPTGYFEFVDVSLFPPGMQDFAERVLGVSVLSFHEYLDDYLEEILARDPIREQYQALLVQIVQHKNELDDEGSLDLLADRAFVRSRAGEFVRPDECYFWSAQLEALLGADDHRWVDESWMPSGHLLPRFRDVLESRLGMPTTVAAAHIVARIAAIADAGSPDEVGAAVSPIVRHMIEHWSGFAEEDQEALEELRNIEFLPAAVGGERDQDNLYSPVEVFRAARAPGFASQVPVIDLTPLRQSTSAVNAVLEFLQVPEQPDTEVVVAHLQHCMSTGTAPNDLTYAILNERVEKEDDVAAIDELRGSAFVYDGTSERFLTADKVFWMPAPFSGYWWRATSRMRQLDALYRRLGVQDEPSSLNYAALMREIAAKIDLAEAEFDVHKRCLGFLCEALERGDPEVDQVVEELSAEQCLINLDGDAIWPEDALWIDAEQLAAPFGAALGDRLIRLPDAPRSSVARFFRHLGVKPISEIARLRLASKPDRTPAIEATTSLRERADLLLWLAPDSASRRGLRKILAQVEIQLTQSLQVLVEIDEFDPPVHSPVSDAPTFFERDASVLHVEGSSMRRNAWAAALKAIFSEIERSVPMVDMKPLVAAALHVMQSEDRREAEQTLHDLGYRPPEEAGEMRLGEELGDIGQAEVDEADPTADISANNLEEEDGKQLDGGGKTDEGDGDQTETPFGPTLLDAGQQSPIMSRGNASTQAPAASRSGDESTRPAEGADGEYKSKAGTGVFGGSDPDDNNRRNFERAAGNSWTLDGAGGTNGARTSEVRRTRTSRMLAYVARAGDRDGSDTARGAGEPDLSELIDVAAIKAALRHEEVRGWSAREQPHGNPGYDIVSTGPDGKRRLIEVKGLEAEWSERGVKLSHVQYGMAQQYREEYWIYVVEHARDLDRQKVSAIANPFQKVDEYWFDHNWRSASEEVASSTKLNIRQGGKVLHDVWGTGTIVGVEQRGIATYVRVNFGFQGVKYVPFSSELRIVE